MSPPQFFGDLPRGLHYLLRRGVGVGFAWGGVPHRSSEGLRFTSTLNCAKFSLAMVRLLHKFSDLRTADSGRRLKFLSTARSWVFDFSRSSTICRAASSSRRASVADAADVSCFDGLPKFADERLQICADFGNISPGDGLVEVGELTRSRVAHPSDIELLDLTHDIVDRIEHVGELARRGGDVIVVRLPIHR